MSTRRPLIAVGVMLIVFAGSAGRAAHRGDELSSWSVSAPVERHGSVVWKADASRPVDLEWASFSTKGACAERTYSGARSRRVAVLIGGPSPTRKFYRIRLDDGDACYGERAELAQGNPVKWSDRLFMPGDDRWMSWAVRLGPGFPTTGRSWQVITQWKQTVGYPGGNFGGSPKFAMEVWSGHWYMDFTSYDPSDQWNPAKGAHRVAFGGAPVPGRWVRFTTHVVFSDDPSVGSFELDGDMGDGLGWRTLVPLEHTATLLRDVPGTGLPVPSHLRVGIYRDPSAYSADTSIDFAGLTVATSRAAADLTAFRSRIRSSANGPTSRARSQAAPSAAAIQPSSGASGSPRSRS